MVKSVIFAYGNRYIEGDAFTLAFMLARGMREYYLQQSGSDSFTRLDIPMYEPIMTSAIRLRELDMADNLKRLKSSLYLNSSRRAFLTTDPRDKVFALLGIAQNKMSVEADYERSVEQVYTATAIAFLTLGDASLLSVPRPVSSSITSRHGCGLDGPFGSWV